MSVVVKAKNEDFALISAMLIYNANCTHACNMEENSRARFKTEETEKFMGKIFKLNYR